MARNDRWEQQQSQRVINGTRLDEILAEPILERLRRNIEAVLLDAREEGIEEAARLVHLMAGVDRDAVVARIRALKEPTRNG